ncbi:hypothetical protein OG311_03315 [Streptomyces sp. NBC_01343]|uniref:hypothetical protein n=1 Tax=Streptomyces sp. NBC_01343 TaxID=2903832 RepID=UPI002E13401D|nr:hypothetical protein OG311_03315 [Streptomyces sp. NBC_01343]
MALWAHHAETLRAVAEVAEVAELGAAGTALAGRLLAEERLTPLLPLRTGAPRPAWLAPACKDGRVLLFGARRRPLRPLLDEHRMLYVSSAYRTGRPLAAGTAEALAAFPATVLVLRSPGPVDDPAGGPARRATTTVTMHPDGRLTLHRRGAQDRAHPHECVRAHDEPLPRHTGRSFRARTPPCATTAPATALVGRSGPQESDGCARGRHHSAPVRHGRRTGSEEQERRGMPIQQTIDHPTNWIIEVDIKDVSALALHGAPAGERLVVFVSETHHNTRYDSGRRDEIIRQLSSHPKVTLVVERDISPVPPAPNMVVESTPGLSPGDSERDDTVIAQLVDHLNRLPPGQKGRPIVFLFGNDHFDKLRTRLDVALAEPVTLRHFRSIRDQMDELSLAAPAPGPADQAIGWVRTGQFTASEGQEALNSDLLRRGLVPVPYQVHVHSPGVFAWGKQGFYFHTSNQSIIDRGAELAEEGTIPVMIRDPQEVRGREGRVG